MSKCTRRLCREIKITVLWRVYMLFDMKIIVQQHPPDRISCLLFVKTMPYCMWLVTGRNYPYPVVLYLLLTSLWWRHHYKIIERCWKLNFLQNVYLGFIMFQKLKKRQRLATYIGYDPRTFAWRVNEESCACDVSDKEPRGWHVFVEQGVLLGIRVQ